ncbi:DUF6152 family protein [Xenophilus azovorans]|uniref:DUF6152 family protein n=1 Tax=Xenophilus azovorans TaxID=151755 RepID=UPI001FE0796F|nr:DUF6152 family protein [Xenophilus azovorans]
MHAMFFQRRAAGMRRTGAALLGAAALALGVPLAQAHHGWSWADGEQTTLDGTVHAVSMAPPHPMLQVKAADGALWQVDLGNPSQTERSGFTGQTTKAGDAIRVLGNRHKDHARLHMKAVRITVGGTHYDMYPERLRN